MTTTVKQPTPQGISALLKRAGHTRAQATGRAWGAAGYQSRQDWTGPGVRVTYHHPSGRVGPEHVSAMLAKYKTAIRDAGWRVETGVGQVLIVSAAETTDSELAQT